MNHAPSPTVAGPNASRSPIWAVILSVAATGLGHIYCGGWSRD